MKENSAESTLGEQPNKDRSTASELQPAKEAGKRRRGRFLALDGLRGFAVLLVLMAHGSEDLYPDSFTFRGGWIALTLFFVLSGFLITHLLLEEWDSTGGISLTNFYIRRTLRIWPLYFVMLSLYAFVLPLFNEDTFGSAHISADNPDFGRYRDALVPYFFFLQNYLVDGHDVSQGLHIFWSLAIEEHFYLFWPLLIIILRGRALVLTLASIAAASFGMRTLTLLGVLPVYGHGASAMTHNALDGLALGCIVACLYHSKPEVLKALSRRRWVYLLAWTLLLVLAFVERKSPLFKAIAPPGKESWGWAVGAILAAVIVAYLVERADSSHPILSSQPLTYIGKVSFAMYLIHPIVLGFVFGIALDLSLLQGAGYFVVTVAYYAAVIGIAGLSFRFFESPILRLKERFSRV